MTATYFGNALRDGQSGWFFGDRQPLGSRFSEVVCMKYACHAPGEQCEHPYERSGKAAVVILVDGGPFVHSFENLGGIRLPDVILNERGDYLVYGPDLLHSWHAISRSTVLTVLLPPSGSRDAGETPEVEE